MKTKIVPVVLGLTVVMLSVALVYEIVQRHRAAKGSEQFTIALAVQLYQGLERGDVEAVKRRLGAVVTVHSQDYEQKYGEQADATFAPRLVEAKAIRIQFRGSSQ